MSFYTDFPLYPTEVFDDTDYPNQVDNTDTVYAALINALKEELQACFTELGTLPKGAHASVKARLDAQRKKIQDADGDTSWDTEETSDKDEIQGKVAGVEFFRGHDDGIITTPKQSSCRAYRATSAQSIGTDSWVKVQFNTKEFDTQSEYDNVTNYRFTAKKGGIYLVSANLWYENTVDQKVYLIGLWKNGSQVRGIQLHASGTLALMFPFTTQIKLVATDYLEIYTLHTSGVNKNIVANSIYTYLEISKLS